MAQLRVAMAQVNPVVGDLAGNARMIRDRVSEAVAAGAHLVAFPEMVLTAYPVEDLALRESFVEASRRAVVRLAADLAADGHGDVPVVVGYLDRADEGALDADPGRTLPQNCAAVIHDGQVVGRYAKHHLPNYGVFDEYRIFAPGESLTVVRVRGVDVAIAICEDLWQEGGPVAQTRDAGAEQLLVIKGSPYEREMDESRLVLVRRRAAQAGCTLA
jgi:NAD+ synthase (glutamine-hydrolysing)